MMLYNTSVLCCPLRRTSRDAMQSLAPQLDPNHPPWARNHTHVTSRLAFDLTLGRMNGFVDRLVLSSYLWELIAFKIIIQCVKSGQYIYVSFFSKSDFRKYRTKITKHKMHLKKIYVFSDVQYTLYWL